MRIIARLDVKNNFVIKGINFEGLRKIGDPLKIAKKYYEEKIDEILFIDTVASLYDRNNLFDIIEKYPLSVVDPYYSDHYLYIFKKNNTTSSYNEF